MPKNKKISVFGSTGFIGSRYCQMYKNDIIKIPRECNAPATNNILYLISTVDNYNVHSNLYVDINTNLTKLMNVLETIKNKKNITFNFVSSWFVYGQNNEIPFNEDFSKCKPTGFYSITKLCAEQLLKSFCDTFNVKYRIFRLSNILGEGDLKISKQKNALQFLISEIVKGNDVHLYYGGEVLRDYMYVDDTCRAINFCINNAPTNTIINIGSGTPYLFKDLIERAIKIAKSKSKIIHIEPTNFHNIVQVRHSYLDITKLKSYGYKPKNNIDQTLEKLIKHYKILDKKL
jgi:nucleoside-diphosphate-sugar epimerase